MIYILKDFGIFGQIGGKVFEIFGYLSKKDLGR